MSNGSNDRLSTLVDITVLNDDALPSATTQLGHRIRLRSKTLCHAGNGKGS
jgi:hypothetical protein